MISAAYNFDVIVIGAGHAGTEAALASARMGAKTALLTMNCDTVGQMSCNPAIGGVAKGQIVREIDALGGEMGKIIDATGIQFRMLNLSKGPAMHSPRAQADKKAYQFLVKLRVEEQENLTLRQEMVDSILAEHGEVTGVSVRGGATYKATKVIITTGTFLQAIMHTGEAKIKGGRAGEGTTGTMSDSLHQLGFELERFKTGTPARINGRTLNFDKMDIQPGDSDPKPFSFMTEHLTQTQIPCYLTKTVPEIHNIIRENLHRAPMYSGQIDSRGPRYCPSIEDKIVRFADKDSHQIFMEPEGKNTLEYYCNGISTSLPRDVQDKIIRLIPGLEQAEIMRYGYAVEYDFAPPTQIYATMETKRIKGLYFAGQINGTTGYEEAGAQGLLAGINAVLALKAKEPLIIDRSLAYIGVLLDDLVTKGVDEPYRMFTSRAEHRLYLRHDNADRRLTKLGYDVGLVSEERMQQYRDYEQQIETISHYVRKHRHEGTTLEEWLKRPEISWPEICEFHPALKEMTYGKRAIEQVVIEIKYAGYIARQQLVIAKEKKSQKVKIPEGFDYEKLTQLRNEAREKFSLVQPKDLAQAGRISGITPADLSVLLIYLKQPQKVTPNEVDKTSP